MDRVCACMPENQHDFLYALAVIQEYQARLGKEAHEQKRGPYEVTLRVNDKFKYYESCFQILKDVAPIIDYSGWQVQDRGEYDCFIDFSPEMFERARAIAKPTKRHITDALGILIGTGPSLKWPVLYPLQLIDIHSPKLQVLVEDWKYAGEFIKLVQSHFDSVECWLDEADTNVNDLCAYDFVIGRHCEQTYLAATIKKSVIEIFPDKESSYLYNSLGRPNYHYVVGDTSPEIMLAMFQEMYVKEPHVAVS